MNFPPLESLKAVPPYQFLILAGFALFFYGFGDYRAEQRWFDDLSFDTDNRRIEVTHDMRSLLNAAAQDGITRHIINESEARKLRKWTASPADYEMLRGMLRQSPLYRKLIEIDSTWQERTADLEKRYGLYLALKGRLHKAEEQKEDSRYSGIMFSIAGISLLVVGFLSMPKRERPSRGTTSRKRGRSGSKRSAKT